MKSIILLFTLAISSQLISQINDNNLSSYNIKIKTIKSLTVDEVVATVKTYDGNSAIAIFSKKLLKSPDSFSTVKANDSLSIVGKDAYKNGELDTIYVRNYSYLNKEEDFNKILSYELTPEEVKLENNITFTEFEDENGVKYKLLNFTLTVFNLSNQSIPKLSASNNGKYLNNEPITSVYIDGKSSGLSIYNGLGYEYETIGKNGISQTKQSWILTPDTGIHEYGTEITVQWKYMGIYSPKTKVNLNTYKVTHY